MTGFSEYMRRSKRPEWATSYLDYSSLKTLLEKFAERRSQLHTIKTSEELERFVSQSKFNINVSSDYFNPDWRDDFSVASCSETTPSSTRSQRKLVKFVSQLERDEFCHILDNQVSICAFFYRKRLDIFDELLDTLNKSVELSANKKTNDTSFEVFQKKYMDLGRELLEIYSFVGVNVTALRQILIRYDGMMRTLDGSPLGQWYIVTRRQEGGIGSDLEYLSIHRDLHTMVNRFLSSVVLLRHFTKDVSDMEMVNRSIQSMSKEMSAMESVLLKAEQAVDNAARAKMVFADSAVNSMRDYFLAGSLMNDLLLQPSFMRTRGKTLWKEIRFFAHWRENLGLGFSHTEKEAGLEKVSGDDKFQMKNVVRGPMVLNLISQLFFMMSHYIIEPSSAKYVNSLGGDDALAGLLIGMTPWAALISGFLYSVWSNHSFRHPLICSAIFLTIGSLVYALASKFSSIPIALIGRFMTGLGSPCTINRRYIADTVPSVHRTAVSALFVTVSAFGMSMGPGAAVLLDFFDFKFNIPLLGEFYVNGMTGPGYFMFILWSVYLVAICLLFVDGERIGLHELASKHADNKGNGDLQYNPPVSSSACGISTTATENVNTLNKPSSDISSMTSVDEYDDDSLNEQNSKKLVNQATIVCMIFIFLGKFVLEVLNSSDSIITRHRYSWSVKNVGCLGFVNGCLVIPIATSVGYLSQNYHDKVLITSLLWVAFLGVFLLLDCSDFVVDPDIQNGYNDGVWYSVGPYRFIAGQIIAFCSIHAYESVVQSTLSKVVPLALAQGTFNSGFIVTTLATLGRGSGDIFITLMGFISKRILLNLLVIPSLIFISICLILSKTYSHKL